MNHGLLTSEEIFYHSYHELIFRSKNWSKYNLLMLSGLLRKLLIDSHNLTHQANRKHKLKIKFEVEDYSTFYSEIEKSKKIDKNIMTYRRIGPYKKIIEVNLDSFLKIPFYYLDNEALVVKDLIKTYSNKAGGIHYGKANKKVEQLITDPKFYLFDAPFTDVIISDISEITIKALNPLAEVISGTKIRR